MVVKAVAPPARKFNNRLQADVLHVRLEQEPGHRGSILHMVDVASRSGAARVINDEQADTV
eukprot:12925271-Prorocentrum_lima.AAC.1